MMTTIDTVKDIIGDCNYYMADVFHVVLLLQKQLDEANANDWQVGSNIPPKPIPEDAVRVGQVKVRHGDLPWEIWVRPTPDHSGRVHQDPRLRFGPPLDTCIDCMEEEVSDHTNTRIQVGCGYIIVDREECQNMRHVEEGA